MPANVSGQEPAVRDSAFRQALARIDLAGAGLRTIPATSTLDATGRRILRDARLPAPGTVAPAPPPG